jgi:hypothetical protein
VEEKARKYDDLMWQQQLADLAEKKADEIAKQVLAAKVGTDASLARMIEQALAKRLPANMPTAAGAEWQPRLMFPAGVRVAEDAFGNLTPGQKQLADKMLLAVTEGRKSLNTGVAGQGAEFVPRELAAELWEWIAERSVCRQQFRVIVMPTDPYDLPVSMAGVSVYKASGECSSTTTSQPTTARRTLDAVKIMADVEICEEFNEDSIIAAVPWVMRDITKSFAQAEENAWINGDVNVPNISAINPAGNSVLACFSGIRRLVFDGAAAWRINGAGGMVAAFRGLETVLRPYWDDPTECVWLIDALARVNIGTTLEFTSVEKIGAGFAFNLKGLSGIFDGTPTAQCGLLPAVDATGIINANAALNTTRLSILAYKDAVVLGDRRRLTIRTDFDVRRDALYVVGTERIAIAFPYGAGSVGYVYGY